jgi:hypothetical protein
MSQSQGDKWHEPHVDESLLMEYLGGELEAARAHEVCKHLNGCKECRNLMDQIEDTLRSYKSAYRELAPPPPRPWADLRPRLHKLDAEQLQTRRRPLCHLWWAAAAAGVAIAFVTMRLTTGQTVSAAELLDKASAVETPVKRTRVKTSRAHTENELSAMFREANFDWRQPLRARAFADWRKSLPKKEDEVRILQSPEKRIGRYYRIRTSTPHGSLSEVSITLRAEDLRAIQERFEFRNHDWVEIFEAPPEELKPTPMSIAQVPNEKPLEKPPVVVTGTDELRVWAALHNIGADLGEPVEVRRTEQAIEVSVLGVSGRREREIRDALNELPNVTLKFDQPQAVRTSGEPGQAAEQASSGSLQPRLLELMGSPANVEAFTNAALEQSEIALARAHAIRQIAGRFPERQSLAPADRETLRSIEADHIRELREAVRRLASILQPLTGEIGSAAGSSGDVLVASQRLDTLLNVALASAGKAADPEKTVAEIRQALANLERAAREYSP